MALWALVKSSALREALKTLEFVFCKPPGGDLSDRVKQCYFKVSPSGGQCAVEASCVLLDPYGTEPLHHFMTSVQLLPRLKRAVLHFSRQFLLTRV